MGHYEGCHDCGEEKGHMRHCKWHKDNIEETYRKQRAAERKRKLKNPETAKDIRIAKIEASRKPKKPQRGWT